jgi:hypothetical protein
MDNVQNGDNCIPSMCSFCNLRDQVSHPYKTTGKITVLIVLIIMCLDNWLELKIFWTE